MTHLVEAASTHRRDDTASTNRRDDTASTHRRDDVEHLSERLDALARDMEDAGLPWAASGIRNVAGMIAAERQLAERLAA